MAGALDIIAVIILVSFSALFSGLTLGLMGLDLTGLEVVMHAGTRVQAEHARKIAPLRAEGNLLLCTLLLGNVAVNAGLSIVLADLTDGLVGFLSSTILIVLFGEIIPQALCSRYALAIGARAVWLVTIIKWILYIFTKPLAMALDYALGEEVGTRYSKNEFKKLVDIHKKSHDIQDREAQIMAGALDFANREVSEIMTPISNVYMLEASQQLDFEVLTDIFKAGYSRIPVYDKSTPHNTITGMLFVKDLILLDPADETPLTTIIEFYSREVPKVFPDCRLSTLLDIFKSGKSHMAIIHDVNNDGPGDPFYFNVGVVTLEDIIETIIQDEIVDETDEYVDLRSQGLKIQRKSKIDVGKLRVFDRRRKLPQQRITPQETSAIFFHLSGTVEIFKPAKRMLSEGAVKRLISESLIKEIKLPKTTDSATDEKKEEDQVWVYRRGEASEYFTLVLDGRLEILAGKAKFRSEIGRWSVLCVDALSEIHFDAATIGTPQAKAPVLEPYLPDFSARVIEDCRLLRISRSAYAQMVMSQPTEQFKQRKYSREPLSRTNSHTGPITRKIVRKSLGDDSKLQAAEAPASATTDVVLSVETDSKEAVELMRRIRAKNDNP